MRRPDPLNTRLREYDGSFGGNDGSPAPVRTGHPRESRFALSRLLRFAKGHYFLNWQPSTKWSKKLGLVSSSMWVMRVAKSSMVARLVAFVSIIVAPWREALPILVMRWGGMMRSNCHENVFVRCGGGKGFVEGCDVGVASFG